MRFGISLPHTNANAVGDVATNIATAAMDAEALGYDSVWVGDHIAYPSPEDQRSKYPHRPDGQSRLNRPGEGQILEPLSVLSYVAAMTNRVRLGTALLVLPYRNPMVVAKEFATLDILSRGRLVLGVGPGWLEEEFNFLNVPFRKRGALVDEAMEVIRELWTSHRPSYEGQFTKFANVIFEPKPVQTPCPPIYVGGQSPAAIRRVARHGDGWLAVVRSPEEYRGYRTQLEAAAKEFDRDLSSVTMAVSPRGKAVAEIIDDIPAYEAAGAELMWIAYGTHTNSFEEMHQTMHHFASEVGLTPVVEAATS